MDINSENIVDKNLLQLSINYKGVDVLCEVDYETASQLLNDHELAQQYAEQILSVQEGESSNTSNSNNSLSENAQTSIQSPSNSCSSMSVANTCSSNVTWSSKANTGKDHEATVLFLQLRRKYATKFNDRKTIKNSLWQKISEEMNVAGYYVGMGKEGAEKCRQKFANLQRTYVSHVTHMRKTGEKKKDPPPYFDELHDILGSKDKVNPGYLEDSLEESTASTSHMDNQSTSSNQEECQSKEEIMNRFGSKKRPLRPVSHSAQLLEVIKQQHREDQQQRNEHFSKLSNSLEKQFDQRERLLDILKANLQRTSRKRKRVSSSSSSE